MKNIFFAEKSKKTSKYKSYANPKIYDPTPPKPKKPFYRRQLNIKLAGMAVGIVLVVWVILFSPIFRIKHISVKGNPSEQSKELIDNLAGINIFLVTKARTQEIAKKQPGIKRIKVLRGIPNSIIVDLIERDPALIWETQGKKYFVDKEGYLYKEGESIYPKVVDLKNIPVKAGDRVASTSFVRYIKSAQSEVIKNLGFDFDYAVIPETTYQIEIIVKGGPRLKIDTTRNLTLQLLEAKYIIENYKDESKNMIDVRVPGYAYIK